VSAIHAEITALLDARAEAGEENSATVEEIRAIFARHPPEVRRAFWAFNDSQSSANHLFLDEVEERASTDSAEREAFGLDPAGPEPLDPRDFPRCGECGGPADDRTRAGMKCGRCAL